MTDEVSEGATVYFRLNRANATTRSVGSVLKGKVNCIDYPELNSESKKYHIVVTVEDEQFGIGLSRVPDHMAPKQYQPTDDNRWQPPDFGVGMNGEEQINYVIDEQNIVEVVEQKYSFTIRRS